MKRTGPKFHVLPSIKYLLSSVTVVYMCLLSSFECILILCEKLEWITRIGGIKTSFFSIQEKRVALKEIEEMHPYRADKIAA